MDRECLKGWILAPSPTDGTNVPFFINVRDKDIIWDEKNLPADIKTLSELGDNRKLYFLGSYWKFDCLGWNVELSVDGTYKAKKKVNIGEVFDNVNTNSNNITATLQLPFSTINDNDFTISITNVSDELRIKSATNGMKNVTNSIFNSIQIYLYNAQYPFAANFKLNNLYTDSFLYVNIEGNVNRQ